jgi:hypothetical protein
MMLGFMLVLLAPVVVTALAVRACWNHPLHAGVAAVLSLVALIFGGATIGRIDEYPLEGTAWLLVTLVAIGGLVRVSGNARSLPPRK